MKCVYMCFTLYLNFVLLTLYKSGQSLIWCHSRRLPEMLIIHEHDLDIFNQEPLERTTFWDAGLALFKDFRLQFFCIIMIEHAIYWILSIDPLRNSNETWFRSSWW